MPELLSIVLIILLIIQLWIMLLRLFPVSDVPRSHTRRARSQRYQQDYPEDYFDDDL